MQFWDKAPLSLGGIATQGPLVRHFKHVVALTEE